MDILEVNSGKILKNIDFWFVPFKKVTWRHYGPFDGLAHDTVNHVFVKPDGIMWLGTNSGGISRYNGKQFINFP
jgi:ligand-binding sensor domain-containing protein